MEKDVPREDDSSHDQLIQDYLENEATPTDVRRFRLLLRNESFRCRAAQFAIDLGHLYCLAQQGMLRRPSTTHNRSQRKVVVLATAILAALVVVGVIWKRTPQDLQPVTDSSAMPATPTPPHTPPRARLSRAPVIARLEHALGLVVRVSSLDATDGDIVAEEAEIRSGQVLRTIGDTSFAVIEFVDHTVFAIGGESELKFTSDESRKRILVTRGDLMAQVISQPEESPMVIETPLTETEILGTKLSLFTDQVSTELAVQEGEVRMERLSDGQTIGVRSGQKLLVTATSDLVPERLSPVSSVWEEDFESGLPRYWRDGRFIHESLPSGSFGAVRAVPRRLGQGDPDGPVRIATMRDWVRGLFRIEPETHLNFSYKLRLRGGFHIRLNTHTDPLDPSSADTFEYRNQALRGITRNQWRTVSVPLQHFRKIQRGRAWDTFGDSPRVGDLAIMISFGTPARDPGLMIDRIWVTRGVPDSAEVLGESD